MRTRAIWTLSLLILLLLAGCGNAGPGGSTSSNLPGGGQPTASQPVLYLVDNFIDHSGSLVDQVEAFKNGKELWKYPLPAGAYVNLSGYALQVTGGVVYAGVADTLYALDSTTGKLLWKQIAGPAISSILVANGAVYVDSQGSQGIIYAFAVHGGSQQWRYELPPGVGRPLLVADNNTVYAADAAYSGVVALDAHTGSLLWKNNQDIGDSEDVVALIPVAPSMLLVETSSALDMLHVTDGGLIWRRVTQSQALEVINGTICHFFTDVPPLDNPSGQIKSGLRAIAASDNKVLWEVTLPNNFTQRQLETSTAEALYQIGGPTSGDITAWKIADGSQIWTTPGGDTYTTLFADDHAVYAMSAHGLTAWQALDGKQLWHADTPTDISSLQEVQGSLFGTSQNNNNVYALNPQNGKLLWTVHVNAIHNLFIA
ncbi:MAG TPA: PQQ-binding-like beta-propeller repeat protein [Ktedonobacteraceae bacterium]|jgi:outer membrane protein assembly factor BamB